MVPLIDSATNDNAVATLNTLNLPKHLITVQFRGSVVMLEYFLFLLQKAFTSPDLLLAQISCHSSAFPTT